MKEFIKLVGEKVRQQRKAQGLSQEKLGEKAGFDYRYIGFVEQNRVNPTLNTLGKIAKALNLTIPELMPSPKELNSIKRKLTPAEDEREKILSFIMKEFNKIDNKKLKTLSKIIKLSIEE